MKRSISRLMLIALGACGGEPVRPPEIPATDQYTPTPLVAQTAPADVAGGQAQQFAAGKDIPAQWWTLFRSPSLDRLVRDALDNSPTIARAGARLRQAQEDLSARTGIEYPKVDAKLSANRVDVKPQSLGVQALPFA